ncbi:MAG: T9SS type A sorting domain-containing protein, partial [Saprospiraceae bacterium]|nr:T9SS type A sorting domain-containing protein [Saprospiraceae bacterium]
QGSTTGFWAGATGLSPGTIYYLRVFASTSCNNTNSGYGTSYAFITTGNGICTTPGTPVGVTGTATGPTTASLDWAAGNPVGSPTVTYYWVVGTSPAVTYGNGVAQGSTTGFWAGATGLSPGTIYYLRVFASTSCNNTNSGYGTSYAFITTGYGICTTPGTPVGVTGTATGPTTASLDWASGNPVGSPTVTYYWVVGTSPAVTYGNGVAQGSTTGFWAGATGLSPGTIYYLRVYASTSCNNSKSGYGTSYAFTTYGGCVSPTTQSSTITFTLVSTLQFTANWVNGSGSKRVVKINTVNNFTPPANGTDPVANSHYVGYGEQVVYNGNGNSVNITGLVPNTTYWIRIYEANCEGTNTVYNTSITPTNPFSQRTRTVLPSIQSFEASNVILNGNTIVDIIPIFTTNDPYAEHPPIDIYVDFSNKTRFTLNASYAEGFSFQLVDQLKIVTDGTMAINPPVYGELGPTVSTSVNSMYVDYTHPDQIDASPYLSLKLKVLFEGGLIGMSFPIHIYMAQSPLPVEVVNFNARWNKETDINEVSWTTKTEINNDFFDVERSFERSGFEHIGRIEGAGNSSSAIDYIFNDHKISQDGNYFYRLRQLDLDGKETYSKPVSVQVSRSQNIKTVLFPNPAIGLINCNIEAYEGAKINIDIFNSLGQKVSQHMGEDVLVSSTMTKQLDCGDYGKGIYTVVMTIDGVRYNHKLILLD